MKKIYTVIILGVILYSCGTPKDISGVYTSNFASNGFFMSQITLKKDSTLEYRRWGDLIFDTATAHYKLAGNKILLSYYPIEVDTSNLLELRNQGITFMENELERNSLSAPKKLLLRKDKLFLFDNEGILIKRKKNSLNKKQKFYLKKH